VQEILRFWPVIGDFHKGQKFAESLSYQGLIGYLGRNITSGMDFADKLDRSNWESFGGNPLVIF